MIKRLFAFTLTATVTLLTLSSCGNSAAVTTSPETEAIKSDEESVISQVEETTYVDVEPAVEETSSDIASTIEESATENNSSTGDKQEPYGSGNFEDYWEGEDYFDLERYLRDVGCEDYCGMVVSNDYTLVRADDGDTPVNYTAWYKGWEIGICPMTYCTADNDGKRPIFSIYADTTLETHIVTINEYGTTTTEGVLRILNSIINAIKNDPDSSNPFDGLNYNES